MIHTILIHQVFASRNEPGGTRHYELGQRLVAQGQRFTVVTSNLAYGTGEPIGKSQDVPGEESSNSFSIHYVPVFFAAHKGYGRRVLSFLSFMCTSFAVALAAGKPDVVMGTTPPIFQALSAWLLAVVRNRPFLLEVRDLWPEFAIDMGVLTNPFLIGCARLLESFLYARADHILVNSPAYIDYLHNRGITPAKISLIPNGVDASMFDPCEPAEEFRRKYCLSGKTVAIYAGAIGIANDLDMLVEAASRIADRKDIQILIVGDGKERRRLEAKVRRMGIANVTFTGAFPKKQMSSVLAASDVCIATLQNIEMFSMTYPNKVFDYMAAGRPTILAIDGVIRKVVEDADAGLFVQPGDADALANAIVYAAEHRDRAREMGAHARAYVMEHFDRNDHARQFAGLIARLASGQIQGTVQQASGTGESKSREA